MSITASEGGSPAEAEDSAGRHPTLGAALSEADAELAALLLRASRDIGLEVPRAPSPERSRLDDWYVGVGSSPRAFLPGAQFTEFENGVQNPYSIPDLSTSELPGSNRLNRKYLLLSTFPDMHTSKNHPQELSPEGT
ncbi:hypothetical protein Q8A67_007274 [Cirrhinus molitorella]|uniref:Uncharacterized protein n=1 Tax=Cirrhinus molitorella TaxID=172907 RepID=A0AA88PVU5_9TELE|nr:hypothetical protein Q8A67_007274 [Cirrhinus molitorella]